VRLSAGGEGGTLPLLGEDRRKEGKRALICGSPGNEKIEIFVGGMELDTNEQGGKEWFHCKKGGVVTKKKGKEKKGGGREEARFLFEVKGEGGFLTTGKEKRASKQRGKKGEGGRSSASPKQSPKEKRALPPGEKGGKNN